MMHNHSELVFSISKPNRNYQLIAGESASYMRQSDMMENTPVFWYLEDTATLISVNIAHKDSQ